MRNALAIGIAALVSAACRPAVAPVPIEAGQPCAFCRMAIADARVAAEWVAPGEEVRQYDDIGCMAADLAKRALPAGGRAFVADYRTGSLLPAVSAVYTRVQSISTPMMSHLVAHGDEAGRQSDVRVRGGTRQSAAEVFGRPQLRESHGG